uniref:Uncharacterized protein n=1 Tax=Mycena chlorophos TaxID=658473 RepID=A0ABQ0LVA8_MYCCL|nr:predicted protein [Mycena chlorophos]
MEYQENNTLTARVEAGRVLPIRVWAIVGAEDTCRTTTTTVLNRCCAPTAPTSCFDRYPKPAPSETAVGTASKRARCILLHSRMQLNVVAQRFAAHSPAPAMPASLRNAFGASQTRESQRTEEWSEDTTSARLVVSRILGECWLEETRLHTSPDVDHLSRAYIPAPSIARRHRRLGPTSATCTHASASALAPEVRPTESAVLVAAWYSTPDSRSAMSPLRRRLSVMDIAIFGL